MRLAAALSRFSVWWVRELAAMLPAAWKPGRGRGRVAVVLEGRQAQAFRELSGGARPLGAASNRAELALLLAGSRGLPVVLRLPAGQALRRVLWLPAAAEENLRQVLSFEMDRETPFSAEGVLFDLRVAARDVVNRRIQVDMLVAPRAAVEEALAAAECWGLTPEAVDAEPASQHRFDLLPPGRRRAAAWTVRAALAIGAAAILLVAVSLAVALGRRSDIARALEAEVAVARTQADAAQRLREDLERLDRDTRFLVERQRARLPMVAVLDALTRTLPDDTWVTQVEVSDGEVQVWGVSPSASAVVRRIEQAPSFRRAEFRSPLTQDPALGLERFHIAARLVPPPGEER